jgi:hypothetical protein
LTEKGLPITGCSTSGIGYYLAKHFTSHNYRVFATARHIPNMGDLSTAPNITLLELDNTYKIGVKLDIYPC